MQRKKLGTIIAVAAVLGLSVQVVAETAPEEAKGYRDSIMKSLGGHIGAASKTIRGLVDDHGQLAGHATGLASSAAELKYIFQEGSAVDGSEALPAIWEQPEKFAAAIKKAEEATAAFVEAIASGDSSTYGAALGNVGKSCRGCHDDFREEHH